MLGGHTRHKFPGEQSVRKFFSGTSSLLSLEWGTNIIYPCIHTCKHSFMHACMHPSIYPFMNASIHVSIHVFIRASIHACIHPCKHLSIHPPTHTLVIPFFGVATLPHQYNIPMKEEGPWVEKPDPLKISLCTALLWTWQHAVLGTGDVSERN